MREPEDERMERKSKSQAKREMTALQELGARLAELPPDQIKKIDMPEDLREALLFAKTLGKNEAKRRHLQYIGALMRDADPEPIQRALDEFSRGRSVEAHLHRKAEQWRDGLVDGREELIEEIVERFPEADRQRLRQLAVNAHKEREAGKPPKSSRALFRYLRELLGA